MRIDGFGRVVVGDPVNRFRQIPLPLRRERAQAIAPAGKLLGELGRSLDLAALVHRDDHRALRHGTRQQGGLGAHAATLLVFDFVDREWTETQAAPGAVEPGGVVVDQVALGAGAKPPHRDDVNPHQALADAGASGVIHIFSS